MQISKIGNTINHQIPKNVKKLAAAAVIATSVLSVAPAVNKQTNINAENITYNIDNDSFIKKADDFLKARTEKNKEKTTKIIESLKTNNSKKEKLTSNIALGVTFLLGLLGFVLGTHFEYQSTNNEKQND